MKLKFFLSTALLLTIGIAGVQAQTIQQSSRLQHKRIAQGVRSGELTRAETVNLVSDQRELHRDIRQAKSDGIVTAGERRDIKQAQRQNSREICRKKHNRRDRN
jgi:low affinity Fe/Cu permease